MDVAEARKHFPDFSEADVSTDRGKIGGLVARTSDTQPREPVFEPSCWLVTAVSKLWQFHSSNVATVHAVA